MQCFPPGNAGLAPPLCTSVTLYAVMQSSNLFPRAIGMFSPIAPCDSCTQSSLSISFLIPLGTWITYINSFIPIDLLPSI